MKKLIILLYVGMVIAKTGMSQVRKMTTKNLTSYNNNRSSLYESIKLQLPGDQGFRDYYVQRFQNNYILNGDIVIPITPSLKQKAIIKTDEKGNRIFAGEMTILSSTADDQHFAFWTVKSYKWDGGRIPVNIDASVYNTNNCLAVKNALDYINSRTCLTFYPRGNEDDYVTIKVISVGPQGQAGSSPVGKQGGEQSIPMVSGFSQFALVHELMHSAGVFHEQGRQDRDNYISININNVIPGAEHNFQIEGNSTSHGSFDFCSLMEYSTRAFALDPTQPVIKCGYNGNYYPCPNCFGSQNGLTDLDIKGLSEYYGQIGVSRFGDGGSSFPMPCGEQYDVTQAIIRKSQQPDLFQYSGGVDPNTLAKPDNGNNADGQGYIMPGKRNNAVFYYSLKSKQVTMSGGAIRDRYVKEGGQQGNLGWPEIDQISLKGGAFERFNHGHIYWTPQFGAFVIKGPIFDTWAKLKWETGPLGYPKSEILGIGKGYSQKFEKGTIDFIPNVGTYSVYGTVYEAYATKNLENGPLGFPKSDYTPNSGNLRVNNGGIQVFDHGYIEVFISKSYGDKTNITYEIHFGPIPQERVSTRGDLSYLSKPTSDSINNFKYRNVPPQPAPKKGSSSVGNSRMINPQPLPPRNN